MLAKLFRSIALTATGAGKVLIDTAHRATELCDSTLIIRLVLSNTLLLQDL